MCRQLSHPVRAIQFFAGLPFFISPFGPIFSPIFVGQEAPRWRFNWGAFLHWLGRRFARLGALVDFEFGFRNRAIDHRFVSLVA